MTVGTRRSRGFWLRGANAWAAGHALAAGGVLASVVAVWLAFSNVPAFANCTLSGNSATCAPPGTGGFVAGVDNLTVTVVPGTTVVDTAFRAIEVLNGSTVINNGSVIAATDTVFPDSPIAIYANGNNNTVINNGLVVARGSQSQAITLNGSGNSLLNSSSGTILVTGDFSSGVLSGGGNTITNAGSIIISGLSDALGGSVSVGISSGPNVGTNDVITNTGTISVNSAESIGILANNGQPTVINSGTINVLGTAGMGISANSETTLLNTGAINALGARSFGVNFDSNGAGSFTNAGTIVAGGTNSEALHIRGLGSGTTIFNQGTLQATGTTSFALRSQSAFGAIPSGAAITNTGTIDGRIDLAAGDDVLTNSGLITVTSPNIPLGAVFSMGNFGGFVQTASGTLALRVNDTGQYDTLTADTAQLAGTLRVNVQPGLYGSTTFYNNVVVGLCGCSGSFERTVSSSPFFSATSVVSGTDVDLTLTRIGFGSVPGLTPNQSAVGAGLERGYPTTPNAAAFYGNLLAATSVDVLDQLSGQGISGAQHVGFNTASQFNNGMMQQGLSGSSTSITFVPLGYAAAPASPRVPDAFAALDANAAATPGRTRLWTTAFGMTRSLDGEANPGNTAQTQRAAGGMFGIDRQITPDLLAGFAVGGSEGSFATDLATSGRVTGGHVGAYATQSWGNAYLAGAVSYARFGINTIRTIAGIGPTETATGSTSANILAGRIELGWKQRIAGYSFTPFVAVEPALLGQQGYAETSVTATGAPGILGLNLAARSTSSLPAFLGVQIDGVYALPGGRTVTPFARASWVHEFLTDRPVSAAPLAVPAASFTVYGASTARDAARLDTGARLSMTDNVSLLVSATGEFSDRGRSYGATASLRATW